MIIRLAILVIRYNQDFLVAVCYEEIPVTEAFPDLLVTLAEVPSP